MLNADDRQLNCRLIGVVIFWPQETELQQKANEYLLKYTILTLTTGLLLFLHKMEAVKTVALTQLV